jgi:hypothetical protein
MKRRNTEDFIRESKSIHGDRYDYSKSVFVDTKTDVLIICNIHGEFKQTPYKHLLGRGCQLCGGSKRLTSQQFLEKSRKIHGDYYNYDESVYINNSTKITILCPLHGKFEQRPADHFCGQGCPKCVGKNKTTEEFIKRANVIHQNKYIYTDTIYKSSKEKVKIICPQHGEFYQIPDGHVNGKKGCPKCKNIISKQEEEFLDFLNIPRNNECRQKKIIKKRVDGVLENTKTIYEFLGDYWHGNPRIFKHNETNNHCNKTFKQLYTETLCRFESLSSEGYNINYIWETDWENWCKNKHEPIPLKTFKIGHPI